MKQLAAFAIVIAIAMPACHVLDKEMACSDFEASLQEYVTSSADFGFNPNPDTAQRVAAASRDMAQTLDPIADDPAVREFQAVMNESADRVMSLAAAGNDARKAAEISAGWKDAEDFDQRYRRSLSGVRRICGL